MLFVVSLILSVVFGLLGFWGVIETIQWLSGWLDVVETTKDWVKWGAATAGMIIVWLIALKIYIVGVVAAFALAGASKL